jgi:hypothetical protein
MHSGLLPCHVVQVTTEGDSFVLATHTTLDAVSLACTLHARLAEQGKATAGICTWHCQPVLSPLHTGYTAY